MPAAQRVLEAGKGTLKSWPFSPQPPGGCRGHYVVAVAGPTVVTGGADFQGLVA